MGNGGVGSEVETEQSTTTLRKALPQRVGAGRGGKLRETGSELPIRLASPEPSVQADERTRKSPDKAREVQLKQAQDAFKRESDDSCSFSSSNDSGSFTFESSEAKPPPKRSVRFVEIPGYGESSAEFRRKSHEFQRNEFRRAKTLPKPETKEEEKLPADEHPPKMAKERRKTTAAEGSGKMFQSLSVNSIESKK